MEKFVTYLTTVGNISTVNIATVGQAHAKHQTEAIAKPVIAAPMETVARRRITNSKEKITVAIKNDIAAFRRPNLKSEGKLFIVLQ